MSAPPSVVYCAAMGSKSMGASEPIGLPWPVREGDVGRRGVLGDSGRLLARLVECGDKLTSSLATIRDEVGLMNDGCGNVWKETSKSFKNGIGVAGLLLGTAESRDPVALFFLENSFSSRSICFSSLSKPVAIVKSSIGMLNQGESKSMTPKKEFGNGEAYPDSGRCKVKCWLSRVSLWDFFGRQEKGSLRLGRRSLWWVERKGRVGRCYAGLGFRRRCAGRLGRTTAKSRLVREMVRQCRHANLIRAHCQQVGRRFHNR